jgi:hypothetical protein
MKRRRKYLLPPPARMGAFPPPLEIIELRSQAELAGEPVPPPVQLIPLGRVEEIGLQPRTDHGLPPAGDQPAT